MKLGNVSCTIIKAPNFFLYRTNRNVETFNINHPFLYGKRKLFTEKSLINSMCSLNFNNNYKHYYQPIQTTPNTINKITASIANDKFNDYLKKTSYGHLTGDNFKEGLNANMTNLLTKIDNKSGQQTQTKPFKTFPKINPSSSTSKDFNSYGYATFENAKTMGNSVKSRQQLNINKALINDKDELFKQTLKDKVASLSFRLVSNKIKDEINQRYSQIEGQRSHNKRVNYIPSFKETFDRLLIRNDYNPY